MGAVEGVKLALKVLIPYGGPLLEAIFAAYKSVDGYEKSISHPYIFSSGAIQLGRGGAEKLCRAIHLAHQ